jgi:DNA-binding MarR family transcriptional regulator
MLHAQTPFWQEGGKQVSLQRLTSELDLTPKQQAELETVLDDFVMYVQTLQAQMDDVRASGKARILRVLDERQKQKFEKMLGQVQQAQRK